MHHACPFGTASVKREVIVFLEGILVRELAIDVLNERHHRRGSLHRFAHCCHQQRGSRTVLRGKHANLPGNPRETVPHVAACVLRPVADLRDSQLFAGEHQQVRDALAEHMGHAMADQGMRNGMRHRVLARQLETGGAQWAGFV